MYSFSIEDNEDIRKFLEGDDSYIPTSELMYLHTRPLLRPNFITQIEDLVIKVGDKIVRSKLSGQPIQDLENYAIQLGIAVAREMTVDTAKTIVLALRKVYTHCLDLDRKLT